MEYMFCFFPTIFYIVHGHVCSCRLTRANAVFQSPFTPGNPLLKVFVECPSCGPCNVLAWVVQVPALRPSVTGLDVCRSFVITRRSQWFCALSRLALSVAFRETNVESKGSAWTILELVSRLEGCRDSV